MISLSKPKKLSTYNDVKLSRNVITRRYFQTQPNYGLKSAKEAKPEAAKDSKKPALPPPKGVPYNKLSIGVPKESWKNERR